MKETGRTAIGQNRKNAYVAHIKGTQLKSEKQWTESSCIATLQNENGVIGNDRLLLMSLQLDENPLDLESK